MKRQKMGKGRFYIQVISPLTMETRRKEVSGYVDNENMVAYRKDGDMWIATDLLTGEEIANSKKKSEIIKDIDFLIPYLTIKRKEETYKFISDRFNKSKIVVG